MILQLLNDFKSKYRSFSPKKISLVAWTCVCFYSVAEPQQNPLDFIVLIGS